MTVQNFRGQLYLYTLPLPSIMHQLVVCTTWCCYFLVVVIDEQVLDNMNFIYYSDIDYTCIV